jgi:peptide methionine sulfoxide reductase msrA/msrB
MINVAKTKSLLIALAFFALGVVIVFGYHSYSSVDTAKTNSKTPFSGVTKTAVLAGGCFWSVEYDLEKIPGVVSVTTGYAGGTTENPTYTNYVAGGHREVVLVTYDPTEVTYKNLVESVTKHSDPTDAQGSFYDRGTEYAPAVYYDSLEEKADAEEVLATISAMKVYQKPIVTQVLSRPVFWPAEEKHQDYATKNPVQYAAYRNASGRADFITRHWGEDANSFFTKK